MAEINIKRAHKLNKTDAKDRITKTAAELASKYGVKSNWKSDTQLTFAGNGADGTIDVGDTQVEVKVKLGMMASMLKGKIEETIHKTLDKELA